MVIAPIGCLATALVMRPRGRSGWKRLALVVAILGLVLISLAPHFNSLVRAGRFRDPLTQRNLLARVELLHLYREHFLAHPWVGSGHLNGRASPLLAFLGEGNARESEALVWGEHVYAHNWLLQTLADSGVVGGLGFVIFLTLAPLVPDLRRPPRRLRCRRASRSLRTQLPRQAVHLSLRDPARTR
jgi:O-antigen ligase